MIRRIFIVFSLASALGGCGLHPLYGNAPVTGDVAVSMASVSIPEPDTRLTQLVRNNLLSTMRPAGQAGPDRYVLTLATRESNKNIIIQAQPRPARQQVVVNVSYQLLQGGKVLTSGKSFSQVSYDIVRQPFSDQQAERDAQKRAAIEVSNDIRTRIAAYFSSH